jgi:outer membrane receptor for ferric coprogen and ferric-rhodotorulic acid
MSMFRTKLMTTAIRGVLWSGGVVFSSMIAIPSYAKQQVTPQWYQIPAGTLDQVLSRFAAQSGVTVHYDAASLSQVSSPGVQGRFSIEEGFKHLLSGTPYQLTLQQGIYTLSQKPAQLASTAATSSTAEPLSSSDGQGPTQLAALDVLAQTGITEGTGSYTTDSMSTATKLNLSIRDTPQMVKVFTDQYLKDTNISNTKDLLRNTTGVSVLNSAENLMIYMRGFESDVLLVDGQRTAASIQEGNSLSIYEHVELLKGAAGLIAGHGNPGGAVNLVRKQATSKDFTGNLKVSYGSWNNYSTGVDLSSGLNKDGTIRGRLVLNHEQGDSFLDDYRREQNVAYGTLAFDLSPRTLLTVGAQIDAHDRNGVRNLGLPAWYNDGTRTHFDPSYNFSADWTYNDYASKGYFLNLKHQFNNALQLKLSYDYSETQQKYNLVSFMGSMDKATGYGIGNLSYAQESERSERQALDGNLTFPFAWRGREQELVVGYSRGEYQYPIDHVSYSRSRVSATVSNQALNFNALVIPQPGAVTAVSHDELTQTDDSAWYLSAKLHLLAPLKLIVGARLSNWKYSSASGTANRAFDHNFSPYVGIIYDLSKTYSVYASYTDIFQPQNYKDIYNHYLDPEMGDNYEVGMKAAYFDGRLNATLSLFNIQKKNVAEAVEYYDAEGNAQDAYRGVDGVVSQGGEFEIDGQITDAWNLSFGYSHFHAEDQEGNIVSTPLNRTSVNLFSSYRLGRWNFGGGANFKSKFYRIVSGRKVQQEAFTVVNLMAGYQLSKNLKAQLNLNNLFNEAYYENLGPYMLNYGATRNATLSLSYRF